MVTVETALRAALADDARTPRPEWLTREICSALLAEAVDGEDEASEAAVEAVPAEEAARRLAIHAPSVLYWLSINGVDTAGATVPRSAAAAVAAASGDDGIAAVLSEIEAGDGPTKLPERPFVRTVARRIEQWAASGRFPVDFPPLALLDDGATTAAIEETSAATGAAVASFALAPSAEGALAVLAALGLRGLRSLLGLRTTRGTVGTVFPPGLREIVRAFRRRHAAASGATLTVGARALAKHCQRSTEGWWGDGLRGTELEKNARAEAVLVRILAQAAWLNVHSLPHDIHVFEVRNSLGYGARWVVAPPNEFRGFLEPQMEDGHAVGWHH